MGFIKEVLGQRMALEGYDDAGFDAALAGVMHDREITKATDACDVALDAVVSLENIQRIVTAGQSRKEIDEGKAGNLGMIAGSILHFLDAAGHIAAVESITAQFTPEAKYRVATEGLGDWIATIWKHIVEFLNKIWTWIKSLFGSKKSAEDTKGKIDVVKNTNEYIESVFKNLHTMEQKGIKDAMAEMDADTRAKLDAFRASIVSKKNRKPIAEQLKGSKKVSTEGEKTIAESIITVLSEIGSLQPCYQSGESYFLVDSKAVARGTANHKEVAETVSATADTVNGFNYGLEHVYIDAIRDAAALLSASSFSPEEASKVIAVLCPTAQKLNANIRGVGTVQDNTVILTGTVSTKTIGFGCVDSTEGLVKAFQDGGSIGHYLAQIAFRTTSDLIKAAEPPLIELCPTTNCVNQVIEASDDLFIAYNDMHTAMYHFDKAITALQKAIEHVQKTEAVASNSYAANFARIALHSVSCYVTQPVKHLNNMTPKVLEAIEAFTRNSVICLNPATAIKYV